jgi:hypothetical protein
MREIFKPNPNTNTNTDRLKLRRAEILESLPDIFSHFYLLSNHRYQIPHCDLAIRKTHGETVGENIIPIYLINTTDSLKSLHLSGQYGQYTLKGGKRLYNKLMMTIPDAINIKGCGCAAYVNYKQDFHWNTSNKRLHEGVNSGGIFTLNSRMEPIVDSPMFQWGRVYHVKAAIIFGPDLVGLRKPDRVDETVGCLIVK